MTVWANLACLNIRRDLKLPTDIDNQYIDEENMPSILISKDNSLLETLFRLID